MQPEPDIEDGLERTLARRSHASRAPWDPPPPRPAKLRGRRRFVSDRLDGADSGSYDDDLGRGAD